MLLLPTLLHVLVLVCNAFLTRILLSRWFANFVPKSMTMIFTNRRNKDDTPEGGSDPPAGGCPWLLLFGVVVVAPRVVAKSKSPSCIEQVPASSHSTHGCFHKSGAHFPIFSWQQGSKGTWLVVLNNNNCPTVTTFAVHNTLCRNPWRPKRNKTKSIIVILSLLSLLFCRIRK